MFSYTITLPNGTIWALETQESMEAGKYIIVHLYILTHLLTSICLPKSTTRPVPQGPLRLLVGLLHME